MNRPIASRMCLVLMCSALISLILIPDASAFEIDQTAMCTYVYDGDSFNTTFGEVRLADIDAPEYNDTSRDALVSLIDNEVVYLDIDDLYQTDPYDRYVCVTYVAANATHLLNVNHYLVVNGYAGIDNYDNEFTPYTWTLYVDRRVATRITCALSTMSLMTPGIGAVGDITPTLANIPIEINFTLPNATIITHHVVTDHDGHYHTWIPNNPIPGEWRAQAQWPGNETYREAISAIATTIVPKPPRDVTCILLSNKITIGDSVQISGSVTPPVSGTTVMLYYREKDPSPGLLLRIANVTTNSLGNYMYTWTPAATGSFTVIAATIEDDDYNSDTSQAQYLNVSKSTAAISGISSESPILIGNPITVYGELTPPLDDKPIILTYTKPDGITTVTRDTVTTVHGNFTDTFMPDTIGRWYVTAMWSGDDTHTGALSPRHPFDVTEPFNPFIIILPLFVIAVIIVIVAVYLNRR